LVLWKVKKKKPHSGKKGLTKKKVIPGLNEGGSHKGRGGKKKLWGCMHQS